MFAAIFIFSLLSSTISILLLDGVETLNRLRKMPGFNTKVVALTADALDGSREKFYFSLLIKICHG